MSAFLGPIHHWLYGKIQLQEAIIARIAGEAEKQGWGTGDKPAADYVKEETRPLDELIDTTNIHGWLQGRIHDAEGRYAQLVSAVLGLAAYHVAVDCEHLCGLPHGEGRGLLLGVSVHARPRVHTGDEACARSASSSSGGKLRSFVRARRSRPLQALGLK